MEGDGEGERGGGLGIVSPHLWLYPSHTVYIKGHQRRYPDQIFVGLESGWACRQLAAWDWRVCITDMMTCMVFCWNGMGWATWHSAGMGGPA